jgi:hypothetical protein
MNKNKVVFIISHKYFRGYDSYTEYYINNIQKFYEDSLIIVVDNNSTYKNDIFDNLKKYEGVVLLDNNIESKFELGAYTVGLNYLIENRIDNYDYIVFTQDNFVLKNKVDFNMLISNDITACPLVGCRQDLHSPYNIGYNDFRDIWEPILSKFNMLDNLDKISFCWCSSFIISTTKARQLYDYISQIVVKIRWESCASERYMARILWELNNFKNDTIDGDIRDIKYKYDCHTVDIHSDVNSFFVKRAQKKNENTIDQ